MYGSGSAALKLSLSLHVSNCNTSTGGSVDTFWRWRYTLEPSNIPSFLSSQADLILRTGKYLNVIKQSASGGGREGSSPLPSLRYHPDPDHYTPSIETAYAAASKTLLHHLINDQHLMSRIRSLKQYFLLAQGDFISQLLSMCETELSKPLDDVLPHRLEFLLELALRTSNGAGYQDSIHTVLLPYTLLDQMMRILSIETTEEQEHRHALTRLDLTGIEGFSLSCNVPWPASLVLDTRTLFCYRMLFRHLFYCKHVERQLCKSAWNVDKWTCLRSLEAGALLSKCPRSKLGGCTDLLLTRCSVLCC
ncbi:Gamma-tubulin complex component protein [Trinorchestia longiramus]|nr:Gamma-tubulin complex component protein [Trinorchestia longiramus]